MVRPFVPEGEEIMDWKAGDLNRDSLMDVVLITEMVAQDGIEKEYANENDEPNMDGDLPRPVILLLGTPEGGLKLAERNDHVTLCRDCGGAFGDPYEGITIKNGYFSIEHYGGAAWRWTRIITFKYVPAEHTWYLHRDGGETFLSGDPGEVTENIRTEKDFGKIKFVDFQN
jgi:hypothetical protein